MATQQVSHRFQLGQLLVNQGAITTAQLDEALEYQQSTDSGMLLGEVVQKLEFCTDERVMECLAIGYRLPFAHVTPQLADPSMLDLLPREFLDKHCVLPLFAVRGRLTVAVSEPSNVFLIEEIARMTGMSVQIVCSPHGDIEEALKSSGSDANDVFVIDDVLDGNGGDLSVVEAHVEDIGDLETAAEGSPVIKLVNYIIYSAVREGASDIHIEPDDSSLRIRFRVDGALFERLRPPTKMGPAIVSRIKIMSKLDIAERRLPQDGGIHVLMDGRPIDLRVSTLPGPFGEKVVIRVIDNQAVLVDLEKLGFPHDLLAQWREAISVPNGIVLVTGPTGSGKSTTLYSVLKELNNEEVNICTVEDPVEFNLKDVNQFQMNEKIGFTFASALRSLLRQDPDVVMLGEIRDAETGGIAVQAALTGHLVLSTLHTNDAPGAITRLINVGVEPYLITAALEAVLAQRLVRKICTGCKEAYKPADHTCQAVEEMAGGTMTFHRGAGCPKCRGTGYKGRIGLYEFFKPNQRLRDVIMSGDVSHLYQIAVEEGMKTLRHDGLAKVRDGITTIEEVFRVTT